LQNYYQILGLTNNVGIAEIKAAFRQLAKAYHPDVNPGGKEQFTIILKAYEVLSDPRKKSTYDYKLNAQFETAERKSQKQTVKDKNWRFDERELKRRQYYNEHIKKYEKKFAAAEKEPRPRSNYNEFKYILFATPLAVLLFLGIMSVASGSRHNTSAPNSNSKNMSTLKMGDAPYALYFGKEQFATDNSSQLLLKNLSGKDLIVCLFKNQEFVRSLYLESNFSAQVPQLPKEELYIRYSSGLKFDADKTISGTTVQGAFIEDLAFYKNNQPFSLSAMNELSLKNGINEGFERISAKEFFKTNL